MLPVPAITTLLSLACSLALPMVAASKRLNVLLLISDDLRPEMGLYGGHALSPNLDALAAQPGAVAFDRAYVQQAICCPTRSSFLTGRRPDTTLVWDLKTQFRDAPGGAAWKTLPQAFKDAGYTTAGAGKVFHPVKYRNASDDVAGGSWTEPYYQPGAGADTGHRLDQTNCGVALAEQDDAKYTDGKTAAHAVASLRKFAPAAKGNATSPPKPFFLAVGMHRPHLPWIVPSKYFAMYPGAPASIPLADHAARPAAYNATGAQPWSWDPQSGPRHCQPLNNKTAFPGEYDYVPDDVARHFRHSYYASVSFMDAQVGLVLDELAAQGLADSTVVAFVGDHGWQLGDLGEFGKKTNFERATRAPFILRDPQSGNGNGNGSSTAPGTVSSALVEFVDLMPTLLELALGADAVPELCPSVSSSIPLCTEGQSLAPLMAAAAAAAGGAGTAAAAAAAAASSRDAVFMQYAHCMHDEPGGPWHDGCADKAEPRVMGYAMRTRRWRYIEWVRFDKTTLPPTPLWDTVLGTELYDHTEGDTVENVAESVNVVADPALADTVAQLSKQLRAGWRAARNSAA
jgi:iduronate 2-sulfatase